MVNHMVRRRRLHKVEAGGRRAKYCRLRLAEPKQFDPKSFRVVEVKKGTTLVVACPKHKFKGGVCLVGTRAQSMLKRKVDSECPAFHPPK